MATSRTGTGKWKNLRERIIRTRPHVCHWCTRQLDQAAPRGTTNAIEIDHLLPFITHPHLELDPANLVLACHDCNRNKGDRDAPGHSRRASPGHTQIVCKIHGHYEGGNLTPGCPHSGSLRKPWDPMWTAWRQHNGLD